MNLQDKNLLKARLAGLQEGHHSLETAGMSAEQIYLGVEKGIISWEELGITSDELDRLLKRFAPAEYVPKVLVFKRLYHEYTEAEAKSDLAARQVLLQIRPLFQEIQSLLQQHLLEPQVLRPCRLFALQAALKELGG